MCVANCVYDWKSIPIKISLHNVFTGGDLERRNLQCVTQISWFGDLFWRWELKIRSLRNDVVHRVFIRFSNIFSNLNTRNLCHKLSRLIKADYEAAEHFICHRDRGLATNHHCDKRFRKLVIFVCLLAQNFILLLLTYFWKLRRC